MSAVKTPCHICQQPSRRRPRAGKARFSHHCAHGRPCVAGDPLNGTHANHPAAGGPYYCPDCWYSYRYGDQAPEKAIITAAYTLASEIADSGCFCPIHLGSGCPGEDCDGCPRCFTGAARRIMSKMDDPKPVDSTP